MFTRYYAGLRRYVITLLPYPTDAAEDALAEVFCTLWASRQALHIKGSLASYLYTAVKHRCLDRLREQRRTILDCVEELPATYATAEHLQPDQLLAFQEMSQQLAYLIEQLPKRTRLVFQLHRDGGLTYDEIAALLGISINSVKMYMFRSLRFLKSTLHLSGSRQRCYVRVTGVTPSLGVVLGVTRRASGGVLVSSKLGHRPAYPFGTSRRLLTHHPLPDSSNHAGRKRAASGLGSRVGGQRANLSATESCVAAQPNAH